MADKEKIRKEVERLQKELVKEKEKGFGSDVDDACILELQNVLTYIDSLQEEPVSNDLEETARSYSINLNNTYGRMSEQTKKAFKAGAQWQKEQIIDKACSFLHHYQEYPNHDITTDKLVEAFKMYIEL